MLINYYICSDNIHLVPFIYVTLRLTIVYFCLLTFVWLWFTPLLHK